ncbi:hypothetical protein ACJGE4_15290 [Bacillus velezensis]|uniref:hypothetical protein n=1 Tax=Bacillus TaxID=1386 RepID=UPI0002059455|nr:MULTISPECIES: hypothetical protein [Bacillus]AIW35037.1 hypothetical protein KS08_15870 [Bacillus subtilis]AEB25376.1 hypothetical protein BAMTA208_16120 [Bacillus amyloliquefaciens TA208]AEK90406.1 hypothetical protein BAXH7_03292 [Bacillus amyloliquefaciens XH7]ASB64817.1 hypothetical protein S101413_01370 [Bacillus velezensis]ATO12178.1 hypothetical protein CRH11_20235 [Bacillus velezensis]
MALSVEAANEYINRMTIDNEDWNDYDDAKQQRVLNVAEDVLARKFRKYVIPDDAVYEFTNVLATAYNDTNRLNKHGIASYSITGVGSFTYKETLRADDESLIPKKTIDLIEEANDVKLSGRTVKATVM